MRCALIAVTALLCSRSSADNWGGTSISTVKKIDFVLQKLQAMEIRLTTRVQEILEKVISMEGQMAGSAKQESLLQIFMGIKEMERDIHKDSLDETLVQQKFATEFRRMNESLQQFPPKEQISKLQEMLLSNECTSQSHGCSQNARCYDAFVGYTCACLPGFSGDGYICEALPCDPPSKFIGDLGCVTAMKEKLSWEDAKEKCREHNCRLLQGMNSLGKLKILKERFADVFEEGDLWVGISKWKWVEEGDPAIPEDIWGGGEPDRRNQECGYVNFDETPYLGDWLCSNAQQFLCQK